MSEKVDDRTSCPHCRVDHEYYRMIYNLYKFDVDQARTIVSDGRASVELEDEDVKHALEWARIYPQHMNHVDVKYPGIVAHYWYPQEDGTVLQGHVLIDGHHRAAKTQELGIPFFVQLLTEDESKQVTLRAPDIEAILAKRAHRAE